MKHLIPLIFLSAWAAGIQAAEPPKGPQVVQVTLHAQGEPRPALRYQLLPPAIDRRPGNAAVLWNRVPAERTQFFSEFYKQDGPWDKCQKWMDLPIGTAAEKELRPKELGSRAIFDDMDRAARFETCEWQLPIGEQDFISILLPEVQQTRSYGRLLVAKAHLEIAEGRFDDAIRTLQTGYALARHVGSGKTIIHNLVGLAIAGQMSAQVRLLIEQPDAPNLYWALASLPTPLVDPRPGYETELYMLDLSYPELRDLERKPRSAAEWQTLYVGFVAKFMNWAAMEGSSIAPNPERAQVVATGLAVAGYPRAKQGLIERGRPAAEVERMPVPQVMLLYTFTVYCELRDDQFKWMLLPYREGREGMEKTAAEMDARSLDQEVLPLARLLLPALSRARWAVARTDREIAALRALSALRLHAAARGQLPDRLADITAVPVPENPVTGKPFEYRREGNTAVLEAAGPPEDDPATTAIRYEITLKGGKQ